MSEQQRIRVRTEKTHKTLYSELKQLNLGDAHAVFFIAACIGYEAGKRQKIVSRDDRFFGDTITPDEWAIYQSIFLDEAGYNLSSINDREAIIRSMEEYANGGINVILENVPGCFDQHEDREVFIKKSERENLLERLLVLIFEKIPQTVAIDRDDESFTD